MNLTRLSCITPQSLLRSKDRERKYCIYPTIDVIRLASGPSIRLKLHLTYYYFKIQNSEPVWAGKLGTADLAVPKTSVWGST